MGTLVTPAEGTLHRIVRALNGGPWRVLWALREEHQKLLPPDERDPVKWLVQPLVPQVELLGSGKVNVFLSHCGASSVMESLSHGVPLVCMPLMCDQYEWADSVVTLQAGVQIDKFTSTPE